MKKFKIILFSLILIIFSVSIGISIFLFTNSKMTINIDNAQTTKYKVTFTDNGSVVKTMFVDSGYSLSLKDAPKYSSGDNYYTYTTIIDDKSYNLANHIKVEQDLEIQMTTSSEYANSGTYNESLEIGDNVIISQLDNDVSLNEHAYNGTMIANICTIESYWQWGTKYRYKNNLKINYNDDLNYVNTKITSDTSYKNIGDTTIGLETTVDDISSYKPYQGNTTTNNSTNYCVTRFTLQNDVIFDGTFNLGGSTGYYGPNSGWSQINQQGFIIGSYNEIDLNGYNLIITDGSTLRSYGSITDSKGTGSLILESGSSLYSPFVVEDYYREDSIPTAYFNNGPIFTSYRMSYLNCTTIINDGAKVYGNLRIDLGGSGDDANETDLALIGPDSSFMIQFASKDGLDGKIVRTVTYDDYTKVVDTLPTDASKNAFKSYLYGNIFNQKITYSCYDSDIVFNQLSITIDYSITFNINFGKSHQYISQYYQIFLYNTKVTLNQMLVFLPGSYLYCDKYTEISFTYGDILKTDNIKLTIISPTLESESQYQSVGGLLFLDKIYDFKEATKWIDSRKADGSNDGYGDKNIYYYYSSSTNCAQLFWNELNKKGSSCDMYGKFSFNYRDGVSMTHDYELGGNINIYDIDLFSNTIKNLNNNIKIKLYASTYKSGVNRFSSSNLFTISAEQRLNIISYHTLPLISNGYVLMDVNNPTILANTKQTYDSVNGTILVNDNNTLNYYAFIYNDESSTNLYKAKTNSLSYSSMDSLAGSYQIVSFSQSTGLITYNNQTYAFYHGLFVQGDTTNGFNIKKLMSSNNQNYNTKIKISYNNINGWH